MTVLLWDVVIAMFFLSFCNNLTHGPRKLWRHFAALLRHIPFLQWLANCSPTAWRYVYTNAVNGFPAYSVVTRNWCIQQVSRSLVASQSKLRAWRPPLKLCLCQQCWQLLSGLIALLLFRDQTKFITFLTFLSQIKLSETRISPQPCLATINFT